MTTTRLFFPAGVKINTTYLAHVGEQSVDQKLEELAMTPAGDWAPNFTGSKKKAPEFAVESFDLVKALDLMTSESMCASMAAGNVDLLYRAAQKAAFAYGTATANHLVYRLQQDAVLYWESIQASQDDELKISLRLAAWYNSANAILTALPSQAIEAPGTIVAPFTLGPIKINGTTILGVKSMSWANGLEVVKEYDSGEAVPSLIVMRRAKPVISFETTDPQLVHAGPLIADDGEPVNSFVVYLRRRRPSKLNYDDGDAMHAKLYKTAALCGTAKWMSVSGDPARVKCELHLHRVGTGTLFDYAKDCAIA
jgi:hypothetical protein